MMAFRSARPRSIESEESEILATKPFSHTAPTCCAQERRPRSRCRLCYGRSLFVGLCRRQGRARARFGRPLHLALDALTRPRRRLNFANDYQLCGDPLMQAVDRGTGRLDNPFQVGPKLFGAAGFGPRARVRGGGARQPQIRCGMQGAAHHVDVGPGTGSRGIGDMARVSSGAP